MKTKIYNMLVNRQPGIASRYHSYRDNGKSNRGVAVLYLLWLNFLYYVLQFKSVGVRKDCRFYEIKHLYTHDAETTDPKHRYLGISLEALAMHDVISFDIFDTLIFRPFSEPADLFYIVGQKLNYMDFKRIRVECEIKAREKKHKQQGTYEVKLTEIWNQVQQATGIDASYGMELEIATELELCYANPYMKRIYDELLAAGKHIVITSDMYLPYDVMEKLLASCGYTGYDMLFVSCDVRMSKGIGDLYQLVKYDCESRYGKGISFAHVGDNVNSDVKKANAHGFKAYHYKNVNTNSLLYRAYDMSPIIGGAYRGVVNNNLYSMENHYTLNQEYGFIYGGLFILGYCHYIHEYCKEKSIDKILFLSRDGEIIKKAYDYLYPDDATEYVCISRLAAVKWTAKHLKYDFLRKMVYHKVNQGKTIDDILGEMELSAIKDNFALSQISISGTLTSNNVETFVTFLNDNWDDVVECYRLQVAAAGEYYKGIIGDAKSAVAVDIGWAGSGAIALKTLFEKEWNIDCKLTGIVAGTNTATNSEPDMSETMFLDGSLQAYLYSSRDNRDLWKKHNPAKGYNLYFELLTSSASPSFKGFYYDESGEVIPRFGKPEPNPKGISEIQDGIMKFVTEYHKHFSKYPYMFNISGRDAYAPMMLAASHDEKYLKAVYSSFNLTEGVE